MPLRHSVFIFFFNDTATTEIYTLSLHDALPISQTADEPSAAREWAGLHVDRFGASPEVKTCALGRVVDDPGRAEDRARAGRRRSEWAAFPEHGTRFVYDPGRVDHSADRKVIRERTRDPERHDAPVGNALRRSQSHERRPPEPSRDSLLDGHGAGERQPVNVHAMLRALSLSEPAAS